MRGSVWVQRNRLFAVSDDGGSFVIDGVPAGNWQLEARHALLGARLQAVSVRAGGESVVEIVLEQP
jgi:hypothetical protein